MLSQIPMSARLATTEIKIKMDRKIETLLPLPQTAHVRIVSIAAKDEIQR